MRPTSFAVAALLFALPSIAHKPAHAAAIISPIHVQTADETASAVDTVALRHGHRHVRHRRHRHPVRSRPHQ